MAEHEDAPADPTPALALDHASRAKADTWLDEHTTLIRLQIEDLRRDDALRRRSLRIRYAGEVIKLWLEAAFALAVLMAGAALGAAVWSAAHADGLVVEAFRVPPDLAAKGLTGEVLAAKVLDRLAALQAQTVSNRPASSYANDWGNDFKIQIPETGVSLDELNRFLRAWLGHETHITGEIYHTGSALSVTARTNGRVSRAFTGKEADLDKLIGQAAEAVYRETQPYRYAVYLFGRDRGAEAGAIYRQLLLRDSSLERAWAYIGLSQLASSEGHFAVANTLVGKAIAIKPDMLLAYENLAAGHGALEHDEQALAAIRKALSLAEQQRNPEMSADFFRVNRIQDRTTRDLLLGDYQSVLALDRVLLSEPDRITWESARQNDLEACAALHDPRCLAAAKARIPSTRDPLVGLGRQAAIQYAAIRLSRWNEALTFVPGITAKLESLGPLGQPFIRRLENAAAAIAHAGLGDFAKANALIAATPLDSVRCLRFRGRIAAMQRDWNAADRWFARAAAAAPSLPAVYTDWGAALLARGDSDGAIVKFRQASLRGPHFADPLEMWGEALMLQNRSDLALAKFAEAGKYAPNWGRLHLKWGEALHYAGNRGEAQKQFAVASRLDLSPSDRTELSRMRSKGG